MEVAMQIAAFFLCISMRFLRVSAVSQNFVVPWSDQHYGPDGPWQAVTIQVGGYTPDRVLAVQGVSTLSVYPGGNFTSISFTSAACECFPPSICGAGGFWEPGFGSGNQTRFLQPARWMDDSFGIQIETATRANVAFTINNTTMWNTTMASASSGNITYPGGQVGPLTLGALALGANEEAQVGTSGPNISQQVVSNMFSGQLYGKKIIPSYSYGLHIGSAAFNYPGSLVFGGYNKGRVIEPIVTFTEEQGEVQLTDISIGVASGTSPFSFTSRGKFLSTPQSVILDPLAPYMALPYQICKNLADVLPVVFDPELKYYLWNTSDPDFEKVVTSGAYLGFSFPGPANSDAIIKVPFALLNLTLETPITTTPVQYFPCLPYDLDTPVLGRAFLQAAFVGRNWNTKISWLAQAPGPGMGQAMSDHVRRYGLGEENIDILEKATSVEGYTGDWFTRSWEGQWSLKESLKGRGMNGSQSNNNDTHPITSKPPDGTYPANKDLPAGAKAGIGFGVVFGILAVLANLFRPRDSSQRREAAEGSPHNEAPANQNVQEASSDSQPMAELFQGLGNRAAESPHPQQHAELPYTQHSPVELS